MYHLKTVFSTAIYRGLPSPSGLEAAPACAILARIVTGERLLS